MHTGLMAAVQSRAQSPTHPCQMACGSVVSLGAADVFVQVCFWGFVDLFGETNGLAPTSICGSAHGSVMKDATTFPIVRNWKR